MIIASYRHRLVPLVVAMLTSSSLAVAAPLPTSRFDLALHHAIVAEFSIAPTSQPHFPLEGVDTLQFDGGQLGVGAVGTTVAASLFDGNRLLGTHSRTYTRIGTDTRVFRFTTPTSSAASDAAIVDFTTIHDGTIDGRIELRLISGEARELTPSLIAISLLRAGGLFGGSLYLPEIQPTLSLIPEPSGTLLATVASLAFFRGKRATLTLAP